MAEVPLLSPGQLGAIRSAYRRIGLGDDERPWRLIASAELLGIPGQLRSTKDLTTVQAGKLFRLLAGFADEADLASAVAAVRRERMRQRFLLQLAAALASHGPPAPLAAAAGPRAGPAARHWLATRSGQPEEVPGAPGHDAAR